MRDNGTIGSPKIPYVIAGPDRGPNRDVKSGEGGRPADWPTGYRASHFLVFDGDDDFGQLTSAASQGKQPINWRTNLEVMMVCPVR